MNEFYSNYSDIINKTRSARLNNNFPKLNDEEKIQLLKTYHPDSKADSFTNIEIGESRGIKLPNELAQTFYKMPPLTNILGIDILYQTDVLIVGGGGAGVMSGIECAKNNVDCILATKLRLGDGNTVMAEGGMQASDRLNDSLNDHFLDAYAGGGYKGDVNLIKTLVKNGGNVVKQLLDLGVLFDKDSDGNLIENHGGGTSKKRMHCAKDYTGLEIMRVLKSKLLSTNAKIVEYSSIVDLIKDVKGRVAGGVFINEKTNKYFIIRAKAVIMATGGCGRLHFQGFPTSNHIGALGEGMAICYRAGASIVNGNSMQYHPTGVMYPPHILGSLVTEKVRSLGAELVNSKGEMFVNKLDTRDAVSSSILKQISLGNGVKTDNGYGVWLDTPMIELIHGKGTVAKKLPNMNIAFKRAGVDIALQPILIYPTLHYQNGGIKIDEFARTQVENLYVIGELSGGIHGENRLMGNSLLDILVFGKISAEHASSAIKNYQSYNLSKTINDKYLLELKKFNAEKLK